MDGFATRDVIALAVLAFVVLSFVVIVTGASGRKPEATHFSCWRCKKSTPHGKRTIDAWRAGKTRFFCGACHATWLQSHPAPMAAEEAGRGYRGRGRRTSPLVTLALFGAIVLFTLVGRSCS